MNSSQRLYEVYGDPRTAVGRSKLVRYNIKNRILTFPAVIYICSDLITGLEQSLMAIIDNNLEDDIRTYDGCYNLRPIRGLEKKYTDAIAKNDIKTQIDCLSAHCWGAAIDINAAWNRLGQEPTIKPELVKCFTSNGFEWGGTFKRKDGMHFQMIP